MICSCFVLIVECVYEWQCVIDEFRVYALQESDCCECDMISDSCDGAWLFRLRLRCWLSQDMCLFVLTVFHCFYKRTHIVYQFSVMVLLRQICAKRSYCLVVWKPVTQALARFAKVCPRFPMRLILATAAELFGRFSILPPLHSSPDASGSWNNVSSSL